MRTTDDLCFVLAARETLAPESKAVLAVVHRMATRRRRVRTAAIAATAAATTTAAVVVSAGVVLRPADSRIGTVVGPPASTATSTAPPAPTLPRPPYSLTIESATAAGFAIVPDGVGTGRQTATVTRVGDTALIGHLLVFDPGSAEGERVSRQKDSEQVTVHGHPGGYVAADATSSLWWEYAPGAMAELSVGETVAVDAMVEIAEAVRFTAPYPVKLPYRLSYVVEGMKPFNVVQNWENETSVLQLEASDLMLVIDITVYAGAPVGHYPWLRVDPIAGRPTYEVSLVDGTRYAVDIGGYTIDVGSSSVNKAEMVKIIEGLTLVNVEDPAAWVDIVEAVPGL
jgi:hypothetical protein